MTKVPVCFGVPMRETCMVALAGKVTAEGTAVNSIPDVLFEKSKEKFNLHVDVLWFSSRLPQRDIL